PSPATKGVTDRDYGESLYVLGDAQDLANRALVSEVNSRQGRPQAEGPRGEHQVLDRGKDAGCGAAPFGPCARYQQGRRLSHVFSEVPGAPEHAGDLRVGLRILLVGHQPCAGLRAVDLPHTTLELGVTHHQPANRLRV